MTSTPPPGDMEGLAVRVAELEQELADARSRLLAAKKSLTADARCKLYDRLQELHVAVKDEPQISDYLSRYPSLMDVVREIAGAEREEFGESASLSLELRRDPENSELRLILYVRFPAYGPDTMDQIRRAANKHDALWEAAEGNFLVTTDYQRIG
jgi:hypothetical protein